MLLAGTETERCTSHAPQAARVQRDADIWAPPARSTAHRPKHLGASAGLTQATAQCSPSAICEVWPFLASLSLKRQRNPAVPHGTTCNLVSSPIATRPAVQLLTSRPSDFHLLSRQLHLSQGLIISPATNEIRHQNNPPCSEPDAAAVTKAEDIICSVHNLGNPTSDVSQRPRPSLSAATQPTQNSAWNQILPNTASRPEPAGKC